MKFTSALTVIVLAAVARAQSSYIRYPTNDTTVHPGETITFQLVRPVRTVLSWLLTPSLTAPSE